jgi:hypothetical protein
MRLLRLWVRWSLEVLRWAYRDDDFAGGVFKLFDQSMFLRQCVPLSCIIFSAFATAMD